MSTTFSRDPRPRIQYTGDGSRTVFGFPFPVLASDDLLVFLNDAAASGFAISGLGDPAGGEVTFAEAPGAGTTVTLLRRTEGIRESAFVDGGPFRAAAINAELDRIMLLIQENREEHNRALRGRPAEAETDFCLPPTAQRANKVLGFDSAGKPQTFGITELPVGGEASGLLVTPSGATTGRTLGEHLAVVVNVRDFGALGDGATDDSAAFQAAITAAQGRASPVYVPASPTAYVLGSPLTIDGITMLGDGAGSALKLSFASGAGLTLAGDGPRLSGLRLLGPGASLWPAGPADVDLSGVSLDGVAIASGAASAVVHNVEVAACRTGIAIAGEVDGIIGCRFTFNREGIELRTGAEGTVFVSGSGFSGCTDGIRADADAAFRQLAVRGGALSSCGRALELEGTSAAWRGIELSDISFADNLDADVEAGPRQSIGMRGCHLNGSGKRNGAAIELLAAGETIEAPNLVVENTRAEPTQVAVVQLSGGTNLNLLAAGDLIVLSADADDLNDHWTALKATRGGVVHKVISQTTSTAQLELAGATTLPLLQAGDVIRVVGRFGTATVDSVGASAPAGAFTWLRADDHCRVFGVHNPMPTDQIELVGANTELRYWPGLGGEPVQISQVELDQGAINGALTRLVTFDLAQDTAASFVPPSSIGMVHVFGHGSLGDPSAAVFTYRADALGYTALLAGAPTVEVMQLTALTGTTGNPNVFTYAAHSDGRIYVENRMSGSSRKVSLFVVGVPL